MAVDVQIRFKASSGEARREMDQLKKEVQLLRQQLGQTQRVATESTAAVDRLGDEAREAAIGVTSLGRNIFKTSAEAKKFGGVFADVTGRLREANGQYAQTREQIDKLGDEARETAGQVGRLGDSLGKSGGGVTSFTRSTEGASRGTKLFTRALGGVGKILGEFGVLSATHLLAEFTKGTVKAAGRLELLTTGLENVEGSSEAAQRRLAELDEIARLPGANLDSLIQFSNRMRSIGISTEETDNILKNVGQSVVVLGGNAHTATEALEQISQALQKNTIIMHDFRPIIQRIPGFLQAVADVHGVEPTLDGMRVATERLGGSVKDALLPVLEELGNRFEAPPPESYVRSVDELHNSFFLFQATLGDKFLPALAAGARGLANLLDTIREFLQSNEPARSAEAFAESLDKINSAASRQQALEDRVLALRRHELALKSERAGLSNSSEEYLNLSKQIQAAQNEQDRWNTVLERSPKSVALLESEIAGLNARYEVLRKRLDQTDGTRTTASLAQTQRQFDEVATSLSVTNKLLGDVESGFKDTAAATDAAAAAIRPVIGSVDDFGGALNQIDTRFLTFHERVDVLTGSIRGLPSEIAAVRSGFDVLAPTAERVRGIFENLNTSLVNSQREVNALDAVTQQILQDLQDLEGLAHVRAVIADRTDVHNANLINQSIVEAVRSFRDYNDVLLEAGTNFRNIGDISVAVTASIRTQASAFDALRQSVDGVALSQSQLQGQQIGSNVFDTFDARTLGIEDRFSFIADNADVFGDVAVRVFDEASNEILRTAESIDTVGDSLLAVSDIAARIALGDLTAAIQLPFRINEVNAAQDAAALQRRQARATEAVDSRTVTGARDANLASVARVLGIPIGRFSVDEAPHTLQGLSSLNNFGGTGLDVLSRNLISGRTDIAGGIEAGIQQVVDASTLLGNEISRQVANLAVNLDRAIDTADIQSIYQPFLDSLQSAMATAGQDFQQAIDRESPTNSIREGFNDYISATNNFYDLQIENIRAQERATGVFYTDLIRELERARATVLNEARELAPNTITTGSILARQRDARALAERTGTDRQFTEDIARAQYGDVAYDAEVAAGTLETVESRPEVTEDLTRIIEAIETRTADRLAQDALSAISEAANDVNVTEAAIIERWEEAVPRIEAWWQELYDDIVNNPDLTDIERTEALSALGTQQDFVSSLKSQYVAPVLRGLAQAAEALQTRTANRLAQEAISAISEAAGDVNATEQEILKQWTAAIPSLENWWQELYEDIINDPNLSDAAQSESLAALGTQQNFVANIKSQYVTPAITGIRRNAEALQTRTANRLAQEALGAISEAASDVNITETEIAQLWTAAVPSLEDWYQELLDDASAIENNAERAEAIAALGSPEQFIESLKSQHVTPILSAIERGREALETRTANREAQQALESLREAANDTNITEQAVVDLWTGVVPLIENWYQELLDDANAIENDAERSEAIAALGGPEQFIGNLRSQYVTPILTGIQRSQEALETRTANRVANDALKSLREAAGDVNITEAEVIRLWTGTVPLITAWYDELLDDANAIENDVERSEAIAALGSPDQFVGNLKSQYVTPVINSIAQSTEALQTRTANREAQAVIGALGTVASDVNVTEQAIIDKWEEAVPFIQTWWQELYDDIVNDANLSDAEIAESLAELGSVESFIGNIRSQYVTPVLNNILQTRFRNRSARAQTGINRAQFNLGGATSESDFERRRDVLIEAINAYYDAEVERINNLEQSEEMLRDLREDNQLAREQALDRAVNITNDFAQERIRSEEQVAAERLRTEERLADDIADLRDQEIENESDRLQELQGLREDHNRRILELQEKLIEDLDDLARDRNQTAEDLNREFQRDFQDLQTETARRLFGEEFGDLTAGERTRLTEDDTYQRELFDLNRQRNRDVQDFQTDFGILTPGSSGYDFYRQQVESGELTDENFIQRIFGRRGLDDILSNQRDVVDVEQQTEQREADINAQAEVTATAIQTALQPLLGEQSALATQQQTTAALESTTATTASETATTAATTATVEASNAEMFGTGITALSEVIPKLEDFADVPDALGTILSKGLSEARIENLVIQGAQTVRFDSLEIRATTVNVSGGTVNVPGGGFRGGGGALTQGEQRQEITVVSPITLNDNILLETQARTTQLDEALNI